MISVIISSTGFPLLFTLTVQGTLLITSDWGKHILFLLSLVFTISHCFLKKTDLNFECDDMLDCMIWVERPVQNGSQEFRFHIETFKVQARWDLNSIST